MLHITVRSTCWRSICLKIIEASLHLIYIIYNTIIGQQRCNSQVCKIYCPLLRCHCIIRFNFIAKLHSIGMIRILVKCIWDTPQHRSTHTIVICMHCCCKVTLRHIDSLPFQNSIPTCWSAPRIIFLFFSRKVEILYLMIPNVRSCSHHRKIIKNRCFGIINRNQSFNFIPFFVGKLAAIFNVFFANLHNPHHSISLLCRKCQFLSRRSTNQASLTTIRIACRNGHCHCCNNCYNEDTTQNFSHEFSPFCSVQIGYILLNISS